MIKFFSFFLFPFWTLGQSLIPNGSFENNNLSMFDRYDYSLYYGVSDEGDGINKVLKNWIAPTLYRPALYCSGVDSVYWYWIKPNSPDKPHSGDCTISLMIGDSGAELNSTFRHYIETELTETLEPGKKYELRLWIKAQSDSHEYSNNLGIHFSDTLVTLYRKNIIRLNGAKVLGIPNFDRLNLKPQLLYSLTMDFVEWHELVFKFTATSCSRYLILGNFSEQESTHFSQRSVGKTGAWYLIDDLSLRKVN
jgi:hypothetical protein